MNQNNTNKYNILYKNNNTVKNNLDKKFEYLIQTSNQNVFFYNQQIHSMFSICKRFFMYIIISSFLFCFFFINKDILIFSGFYCAFFYFMFIFLVLYLYTISFKSCLLLIYNLRKTKFLKTLYFAEDLVYIYKRVYREVILNKRRW